MKTSRKSGEPNPNGSRSPVPPSGGTIVVAGDVTLDRFLLREEPRDKFANANENFRAAYLYEEKGGACLIHKILDELYVVADDSIDPASLAKRIGDEITEASMNQPKVLRSTLNRLVASSIKDAPSSKCHYVFPLEGLPTQRRTFHHQFYQMESFPLAPSVSKPPKGGGKSYVWRVAKELGGSPGPATRSCVPLPKNAGMADVVVVSDTNLGFALDEKALNACHGANAPILVVRHGLRPSQGASSRPMVGEMWQSPAVKRAFDQMVLVINIDDFEGGEVFISRDLSWERTIEDLCFELWRSPNFQILRRARHLVITLGRAGSIYLYRKERDITKPSFRDESKYETTLFYRPTETDRADTAGPMGQMIGATSLLTASIAHCIANGRRQHTIDQILPQAILLSHRAMNTLFDVGFGPVSAGMEKAEFPYKLCAREIARPLQDHHLEGYLTESINLKEVVERAESRRFTTQFGMQPEMWSLLTSREQPNIEQLAKDIVVHGAKKALQAVPHAQIGSLVAVDRSEVEAYRETLRVMRAYCRKPKDKPLSIAVFGQPGNGKSFGIKQIIDQIERETGADIVPLEFNLSQFSEVNPDEQLLIAFHLIRDTALKGKIPIAFWDEFDSKDLRYLARFLAPMQDGNFVEGAITHPIGSAIFIFIGGVKHRMSQFLEEIQALEDKPKAANTLGTSKPLTKIAEPHAGNGKATLLPPPSEAEDRIRTRKLPDFISRLRGYVDVRSLNPEPNGSTSNKAADQMYMIRRALLMRNLIERNHKHLIDDSATARIDPVVIAAFLLAKKYKHGARSLEALLETSRLEMPALTPSCLPSEAVLRIHVEDPADFLSLACGRPNPERCLSLTKTFHGELSRAVHDAFKTNCPPVSDDEIIWIEVAVTEIWTRRVLRDHHIVSPHDAADDFVRTLMKASGKGPTHKDNDSHWLYQFYRLQDLKDTHRQPWSRIETAVQELIDATATNLPR